MEKNALIHQNWIVIYWKLTHQGWKFSISLSVIGFLLGIWATIAGFQQLSDFATNCSALQNQKLVLGSIKGVLFMTGLTIILSFRFWLLLFKNQLSYFLSLLMLILGSFIFWLAYNNSDQVMRQISIEAAEKGLMFGLPPLFMLGTKEYCLIAITLFLFLSLSFEMSLLLVSLFKSMYRESQNMSI